MNICVRLSYRLANDLLDRCSSSRPRPSDRLFGDLALRVLSVFIDLIMLRSALTYGSQSSVT